MEWLKGFFYKKKTREELKRWLEEEKKLLAQKEEGLASDLAQEFPLRVQEARAAVAALETAGLVNPNIPERAKHFMKGNKEQLARLTQRFLDDISIPKTREALSELDERFHEYAQGSSRPAGILREFVEDEVKALRKALADIEQVLHDLRSLFQRKEELHNVGERLMQLDDVAARRENAIAQRVELDARIVELKGKIESAQEERAKVVASSAYAKVKEDILGIVRERQLAQDEIAGLFAPIADVIQKFAHEQAIEKIDEYAKNPVQALIHDYDLSILKHIAGIQALLREEGGGHRPERAQKALKVLPLVTKENLSRMIHRYANARKKESQVQQGMGDVPVMREFEAVVARQKELERARVQFEEARAKVHEPDEGEIVKELSCVLAKFKIQLV